MLQVQTAQVPVLNALVQAMQNRQRMPAVSIRSFIELRELYDEFKNMGGEEKSGKDKTTEMWDGKEDSYHQHLFSIAVPESWDKFLLQCGSFINSMEFESLFKSIVNDVDTSGWENVFKREYVASTQTKQKALSFALYALKNHDSPLVLEEYVGVAFDPNTWEKDFEKKQGGPYAKVSYKTLDNRNVVVDLSQSKFFTVETFERRVGAYIRVGELQKVKNDLLRMSAKAALEGNDSNFFVVETRPSQYLQRKKLFDVDKKIEETITDLRAAYDLRGGFASHVFSSPMTDELFLKDVGSFLGEHNSHGKAYTLAIAQMARNPNAWGVKVRVPDPDKDF